MGCTRYLSWISFIDILLFNNSWIGAVWFWWNLKRKTGIFRHDYKMRRRYPTVSKTPRFLPSLVRFLVMTHTETEWCILHPTSECKHCDFDSPGIMGLKKPDLLSDFMTVQPPAITSPPLSPSSSESSLYSSGSSHISPTSLSPFLLCTAATAVASSPGPIADGLGEKDHTPTGKDMVFASQLLLGCGCWVIIRQRSFIMLISRLTFGLMLCLYEILHCNFHCHNVWGINVCLHASRRQRIGSFSLHISNRYCVVMYEVWLLNLMCY